jgi:hypothetical protein
MTDAEVRDWALRRYGSEQFACKLAIVRQMQADVQAVEHIATSRTVLNGPRRSVTYRTAHQHTVARSEVRRRIRK